ncbi:MAG: hypothetical protein ACPGSI_15740 [Pikeienuella sp.]
MCELTLAIRQRLLDSYGDPHNPVPGLIDHLCMSAGEAAVEALMHCGLSDGRFRQASIADKATCAAFLPSPAHEKELGYAFFGLEVIQHEELPNNLKMFNPPDRLRAACERLVMRGDLMAAGGGFAWPLDRLAAFRRGFAHEETIPASE